MWGYEKNYWGNALMNEIWETLGLPSLSSLSKGENWGSGKWHNLPKFTHNYVSSFDKLVLQQWLTFLILHLRITGDSGLVLLVNSFTIQI